MQRLSPGSCSIATLATALIFYAIPLFAQGDWTDTPIIEANGTVTRSVPPNSASMTLTFSVVDSTPARAGARLAIRADSVRRALVAIGIPRDSLITASKWYWWPQRLKLEHGSHCAPLPPPRVGCQSVQDSLYRATESIEVRVNDLSKVGAAIDAALGLRVFDISPIRFKATDIRDAQDQALREATTRAREQAAILASAGGVKLGRTLSLSTRSNDYTSQLVLSAGPSSGNSTEITFPSVPVTVTVYGRWAIQGN